MAVSVHTIAFKGYSGVGFILLMLACIGYFMAYTSNSWVLQENDTFDYIDTRAGIWESCVCTAFHHDDADVEDWLIASQVFLAFGLFGLVVAAVLSTLYMCVHQISKNATLIALVVVCFGTSVFMFIGIVIYGAEIEDIAMDHDLNWSFGMAIVGMCFTIAAGVVSILQMKASEVACFNG